MAIKINVTKLNKTEVKKFNDLKKECSALTNEQATDFLNDFIYYNGNSVSYEYLKCVYRLEEYYNELYLKDMNL